MTRGDPEFFIDETPCTHAEFDAAQSMDLMLYGNVFTHHATIDGRFLVRSISAKNELARRAAVSSESPQAPKEATNGDA